MLKATPVRIRNITDEFSVLYVIRDRQMYCAEKCTDVIDGDGELMGGNA